MVCVEVYRGSICNLALTRSCNSFTNISYEKEAYMVYAVGLKPTYGGSIPSFLVLEQRLVPRKCGTEGGSREFIQCWCLLVLVGRLYVWMRKLLR